ncbi:MAG: hypothetical protein ACYTEX_23280 [Planctomycetota bacterium]|jgi:hypothetical protein
MTTFDRALRIATLATLLLAGGVFAGVITTGGAGVTGTGISTEGGHHYYGGMGIYENTDAMTIDSSTWQLIYTAGDWTTGLVNGMTFQDGATDTVSDAYADAGGSPNEVTVTAAAHPFAAGEIVSISGSTNYNSVFEIQSATTDTFNIVSAFAAEGAAGTVTRSGNITITNAGAYKAVYHVALSPANANDIIDVKLYAGSTAGVPDSLDMSESRHEAAGVGKFSTVAGCDIFTASAGDVVSLAVKNISGANNVTLRYVHVSIFQL